MIEELTTAGILSFVIYWMINKLDKKLCQIENHLSDNNFLLKKVVDKLENLKNEH